MKIKLLPVFIAGMLMTGIAVSATDDAFAESSSKMVSGKSHSKTVYLKKQAQVDKTEVIKGLDSEDISDLPTSKTFTIRSDKAQDATVEKELKRAGVTLKVSGHDEDGIPNSWDATIVYRGLETYLEKYVYTVEVTPKDRAAKSIPDTRTVASTDKKDYNDLTEEEAVERNQKIVKEKYLQVKNNEVPQKAPVKEPEPESSGWKTADIIKFLGLIAVLSIVSFLIFSALTRRRHKA